MGQQTPTVREFEGWMGTQGAPSQAVWAEATLGPDRAPPSLKDADVPLGVGGGGGAGNGHHPPRNLPTVVKGDPKRPSSLLVCSGCRFPSIRTHSPVRDGAAGARAGRGRGKGSLTLSGVRTSPSGTTCCLWPDPTGFQTPRSSFTGRSLSRPHSVAQYHQVAVSSCVGFHQGQKDSRPYSGALTA